MPISLDDLYPKNESDKLDYVTRRRMTERAENNFWLSLLAILAVFMMGFLAGSIAHDGVFHSIEQQQLQRK